MALSSDSEGFTEALAVGLGRLEEGLAVLAVSSPLITNLNCPGARDEVCQCLPEQKRGNPSWCIPPIPMPLVTAEQVAVAVRVVWPKIVAETSQIDLTADTVARVNAQLRGAARGLEVYAPDPDRTERTLQALDGTRPGLWDAEDFRGMWPQHY